MRQIILYKPKGSNFAPCSKEKLLSALQSFGNKIESLDGVELVELTINVLEDGEPCTIELHRGGQDDGDGLNQGGGWLPNPVIGVFRYYDSADNTGYVPSGFVEVNGEHVQSCTAEVGQPGFPYRNLQPI